MTTTRCTLFRLCAASAGELITNSMRLTPVRGDNGGFCLINTSFQYNAFFRVTDEQASTASEGSERERKEEERGAQQAAQRLRGAVCVNVCVRVCVCVEAPERTRPGCTQLISASNNRYTDRMMQDTALPPLPPAPNCMIDSCSPAC